MTFDRARAALDRATRGTPDPASTGHGKDDARLIRGLAIGALVGAAIAGSTIWQRRRVRGRIRRELVQDAGE